jgi:hypothetical protein
MLFAQAAVGQTADVPPEFWDRPRTARAFLEQPQVKQVIAAALAKPESTLLIHHGSGQEPLVQAEELRSWLVALAIEPRRIALRGGLAAGSPVSIEIVP